MVTEARGMCSSLTEVIFASNSQLRVIDGFENCTSLRQIGIPRLVEKIDIGGFNVYLSLNKVIFASDSHIREIDGFSRCPSLSRTGHSRLSREHEFIMRPGITSGIVHTEKKQNRENCRISKTPYWVVAIMV
jgi:hypothetical protein